MTSEHIKKHILVINPINLFPVTMMSQVRTINLVKGLAKDHVVDVAALCPSQKEIEASREGLKDICRNFYPIRPLNPKNDFLRRKYYGLKHLALSYLAGISKRYATFSNKKITGQLLEIIAENNYDIVQVEYWYLGNFFPRLPRGIFKVIDSHAMVEENRDGYLNKVGTGKSSFFRLREYKKSIGLQYRCFDGADLVMNISRQGEEILARVSPGTKRLLVPIGQDIDHFKNYPVQPGNNTVLFFGSMGSQQNKRAFFRLWEKILPLVKEQIPAIKLLVVGSKPPENIKCLHDGKNVVVTGFVEDPREYLSKAGVMVLPLDTGSGFRGRIVEIMAMGIPVVGTHNALDSIGMTGGVHGYISDSDREMADAVTGLLKNRQLREKMSRQCIEFVTENYSNEATAGKLSDYYMKLEK